MATGEPTWGQELPWFEVGFSREGTGGEDDRTYKEILIAAENITQAVEIAEQWTAYKGYVNVVIDKCGKTDGRKIIVRYP